MEAAVAPSVGRVLKLAGKDVASPSSSVPHYGTAAVDFSRARTTVVAMSDGDVVVITEVPAAPEPPSGCVGVQLKCTADTWWKAITAHEAAAPAEFAKTVVATQDAMGRAFEAHIHVDELAKYCLVLSKAKFLGIHTHMHLIQGVETMVVGKTIPRVFAKFR